MSEGIIDLSGRAVAAMNMGDNALGDMRRTGGREGFHTVADEEHDFAPKPLKRPCHPRHGRAG